MPPKMQVYDARVDGEYLDLLATAGGGLLAMRTKCSNIHIEVSIDKDGPRYHGHVVFNLSKLHKIPKEWLEQIEQAKLAGPRLAIEDKSK